VDDIGAIELDVLDERATVFAVENDVFLFAGRPAPLHDDADGIGRAHRRMRHVRRNEESFAFADEMIDDFVAVADAHFDVALEVVITERICSSGYVNSVTLRSG